MATRGERRTTRREARVLASMVIQLTIDGAFNVMCLLQYGIRKVVRITQVSSDAQIFCLEQIPVPGTRVVYGTGVPGYMHLLKAMFMSLVLHILVLGTVDYC